MRTARSSSAFGKTGKHCEVVPGRTAEHKYILLDDGYFACIVLEQDRKMNTLPILLEGIFILSVKNCIKREPPQAAKRPGGYKTATESGVYGCISVWSKGGSARFDADEVAESMKTKYRKHEKFSLKQSC